MTPEEALQMLIAAGLEGAAYDPNNTGRATDPTVQWSQGNPQEVTDARILDGLAAGFTRFKEGPQGPVAMAMGNIAHPGMDRVNANTASSGIRADRDKDGNITLTNLVAGTQTPIQKNQAEYDSSGNPFGLPAKQGPGLTVANTVTGLIKSMRAAEKIEDKRAIYNQLTEAAAQEKAKLYAQAQEVAASKMGIPELEQDLLYMQSLEQRSPGWVQGMPESPQTLAVRQRLEQARGLADKEAERWINGNVGAAGLMASVKTAEAEFVQAEKRQAAAEVEAQRVRQRTEAQEDRQAAARDQLKLNNQLRDEDRKQQEEAELDQMIASFTQQQKDAARVLFPEKATDRDVALTIKATKDKETLEVLNAEEGKLPYLAITGNTKALKVLQHREAQYGLDEDIVKEHVRELRQTLADPNLLQKGLNKRLAGLKEEDRKREISSMQAKQVTGTKEEKLSVAQAKYDMAMELLQEKIKTKHTNRLDQWAVADPEFQAAVNEAKDLTKEPNLANVLGVYLRGSASFTDRKQRLEKFKEFAKQSAAKTKGSQFGTVDPVELTTEIETAAVNAVLRKAGMPIFERGAVAAGNLIGMAFR